MAQPEMTPAYTTRIAPSPTGNFHIGTARTAYFNWLAARASGGRFILRIDDTDLARNNGASVDVIHDCLDWLGLIPDAVHRQSDRLDLYHGIAGKLISAGRAVRADNGAILLADGAAGHWHDLISGNQAPSGKVQDLARNQVLIKADGMPVYHFASVVDDADMGINLVLRGIDHMTNTYRHTAIYDALGHPLPHFAHLGLITLGGKKMSKRDAAASLLSYRDAGVDRDAMLNFLLRMGWGPSCDDKSMALIDRDRATGLFLQSGRMRASPATFDPQKLASFDRKYKAKAQRPSP
ncbi:glutamate--tRNA ligase [Leisingera sp. XS_AS12]|uniref:glutamate--tRNA ligase n=1 Tax=Leisingera sp. XS_AS12 TaxID=3241294 RepID=UPI0035112D5C